jgi:predicted AlkP superfamily phosphohydrolase/phosphomutase/tetratricopeptide (TPR) repeat protein
MGKRLAKKVLLIGWDAADWKVINPLMDAGHLPTLEKLVNGGVMGNLATLDPPLSPMLWTSIGTGKRPYKHGILGFTEPSPDGSGIRPIYNVSRKVKAVWNILNQHNLKSHVIGWWPSHPAEPIDGITISNFYQKAKNAVNEPWPMMDGTVHPKEMSELFAKLRVHPGELTAQHILPFVPEAANVDQEKDKRLVSLAKVIADCTTIHSATTYIMENEEWDFLAVYYDAIDHFCHGFMKFHPPQLPGIPDDMYNMYKDVVISGYKYHDMMLERLIELAGEDTTIMLISDHGFHPDHLRPLKLPKEPAAPALEHSPYGIYVLNGPNVRKDERIYGASVLDVTPTVLHLFGLPVAKDMDGNVLVNSFDGEQHLETVDSWEDIPGNTGQHPKDMLEDNIANQEAMDQLIELGYIDKPDDNIENAIKKTVAENEYYLARAYIDGHKMQEAIPILERLHAENPEQSRYAVRLSRCYQNVGRIKDCRTVLDKLMADRKDKISPGLHVMNGTLKLSENKPKKALEDFKKAEKMAPKMAKLHLQIGRGYMMLSQWEDAQRAFEKELEHDHENAPALHGLGMSFLRNEKAEEAIEPLLNAVGLLYHFPFAHYHLGEALYKIGDPKRAAEAFEVSLKMAPGINKARQWLKKIYAEDLKEPEKAAMHEASISENTKGVITVVSGLPRSGTSMMMQMLQSGGMEVFSDGERAADQSNPKGYHEHEAVKGLMRNKEFLNQAPEKVVKVISHLLSHLPARYEYKVIFMERELSEILRSQHTMLLNEGKAKKDAMPLKLVNAFTQNLEKVKLWMPKQENLTVLYVSHRETIENPRETAEKVKKFLGEDLNVDLMVGAVDPKLHRQKNEA